MLIQDRDASREVFFRVWHKHREGQPMERLEMLILSVIIEHPEYHSLLVDRNVGLHKDFLDCGSGSNPFLHMGLHIALLEQLGTDRPAGVADLYRQLRVKKPDEHLLQHSMMDCLEQTLWQAQSDGCLPNESGYLESLGKLG
jgi:hypothetical protein